jgi:predicted molibdopterin-dependent oxidoreductase YjgC
LCDAGRNGTYDGERSNTDAIRGRLMRKPRHVRLTEPLVRENGELRPATWDEALARAAAGLRGVPAGAFGMFSCSKATNEMNYAAEKFARVVMGSNNVDSCNRT